MKRVDPSAMNERLRAAGKRLTSERELLFEIIAENPHKDATAIYRLAVAKNPKIGLATVYRTLSLLAELGLVDVATLGEDHGHYEIHREDHVHLICLSCGRIREVPPPANLRKLGEDAGFDVCEAQLEITGYCRSCKDARTPSNGAGT